MQWQIQTGNITIVNKVKIDMKLAEFRATKIVKWNGHVYEFTKIRYDMILGRGLLTVLGIYLELYNHIIEGGDGPFDSYTAPMVDLGTYECKKNKHR